VNDWVRWLVVGIALLIIVVAEVGLRWRAKEDEKELEVRLVDLKTGGIIHFPTIGSPWSIVQAEMTYNKDSPDEIRILMHRTADLEALGARLHITDQFDSDDAG